jgi:uncharacterized protein YgbK (DUF1537 family)
MQCALQLPSSIAGIKERHRGCRTLVITDDITGQLGLASLLRSTGASVGFNATEPAGTDVIVVNTRTRDVSEPEAVAAVTAALNQARCGPYSQFVKRVDSTLRGSVAAEVAVMAKLIGATGGVFAPANPAAGRMTVQGEHYADGHGVGDLRDIVAQMDDVRSVHMGGGFAERPGAWWVPDITSPEDIHRVAEALPRHQRFLIVDSGALTAVLCGESCSPRVHSLDPSVAAQRRERPGVMVVQGSSSNLVAQQINTLRRYALPDIEIFYHPVQGAADTGLEQLVERATNRLSRGDIGGVVVGGGLTAEALFDKAGIHVEDLLPLRAPGPLLGLARVASGEHAGLLIATKGGRIGSERVLVDLVMTMGLRTRRRPHSDSSRTELAG